MSENATPMPAESDASAVEEQTAPAPPVTSEEPPTPDQPSPSEEVPAEPQPVAENGTAGDEAAQQQEQPATTDEPVVEDTGLHIAQI